MVIDDYEENRQIEIEQKKYVRSIFQQCRRHESAIGKCKINDQEELDLRVDTTGTLRK